MRTQCRYYFPSRQPEVAVNAYSLWSYPSSVHVASLSSYMYLLLRGLQILREAARSAGRQLLEHFVYLWDFDCVQTFFLRLNVCANKQTPSFPFFFIVLRPHCLTGVGWERS